MRAHRAKAKPSEGEPTAGAEQRGKQTKTGNSSGFRFEGALLKSHPEFNGDVTAYVLAPVVCSSRPTQPLETKAIPL
jgi:hypothetical protein